MTIADTILQDHAVRKDAEGVSWYTAKDLERLGLRDPLFSVMLEVQHVLRRSGARQVVESGGNTDRWSLRDC